MADYRFIGGDGKEYGPYPIEQMRQFMAENRLVATSQVSMDGGPFQPASSFPELGAGTPQSPMGGTAGSQQYQQMPGQPMHAQPMAAGQPVPNYLVQSILVTLCCCLPLGIPAIVYSAKVDGLVSSGQHAAAVEASNKAKMWGWIAFGLGIVANIIIIGLQVAAQSL